MPPLDCRNRKASVMALVLRSPSSACRVCHFSLPFYYRFNVASQRSLVWFVLHHSAAGRTANSRPIASQSLPDVCVHCPTRVSAN